MSDAERVKVSSCWCTTVGELLKHANRVEMHCDSFTVLQHVSTMVWGGESDIVRREQSSDAFCELRIVEKLFHVNTTK